MKKNKNSEISEKKVKTLGLGTECKVMLFFLVPLSIYVYITIFYAVYSHHFNGEYTECVLKKKGRRV